MVRLRLFVALAAWLPFMMVASESAQAPAWAFVVPMVGFAAGMLPVRWFRLTLPVELIALLATVLLCRDVHVAPLFWALFAGHAAVRLGLGLRAVRAGQPALLLVAGALAFLHAGPAAAAAPSLSEVPAPMIIGHRGAPGHLPDHTLEGYRLAVAQGADAIEPDLVFSKDGVLVVRHENNLAQTTDLAAHFPERRRTAVVDGETVDGWFTEDFTLAELCTLRAVQPWPDRPHDHDGLYTIPTFDEVLALAAELSASSGRTITVVPEAKHPSYFASIAHDFVPALQAAFGRAPQRVVGGGGMAQLRGDVR